MFDRLHTQAASGDVAANATAAMVLQQLGHYIRQAAPGEGLPCHCLSSLRLSGLGCLALAQQLCSLCEEQLSYSVHQGLAQTWSEPSTIQAPGVVSGEPSRSLHPPATTH